VLSDSFRHFRILVMPQERIMERAEEVIDVIVQRQVLVRRRGTLRHEPLLNHLTLRLLLISQRAAVLVLLPHLRQVVTRGHARGKALREPGGLADHRRIARGHWLHEARAGCQTAVIVARHRSAAGHGQLPLSRRRHDAAVRTNGHRLVTTMNHGRRLSTDRATVRKDVRARRRTRAAEIRGLGRMRLHETTLRERLLILGSLLLWLLDGCVDARGLGILSGDTLLLAHASNVMQQRPHRMLMMGHRVGRWDQPTLLCEKQKGRCRIRNDRAGCSFRCGTAGHGTSGTSTTSQGGTASSTSASTQSGATSSFSTACHHGATGCIRGAHTSYIRACYACAGRTSSTGRVCGTKRATDSTAARGRRAGRSSCRRGSSGRTGTSYTARSTGGERGPSRQAVSSRGGRLQSWLRRGAL
jgi:hypothetical protein